MDIDLTALRDLFFQEAEEHLAAMESTLLRVESSGERDAESLDAIFRSAHSIKGASGTFGLDDVGAFTHAMETLLDEVRAGRTELTAAGIGLLLRAVDVLRGKLAAAREGGSPPPDTSGVLESLKASTVRRPGSPNSEDAVAPTGACVYRICFRPYDGIFGFGMDPLLVLRELRSLGTVLETGPDLSRLPRLAEIDPHTCYLSWTVWLSSAVGEARIRDVFAFVEDAAEIAIQAERATVDEPPPAAAQAQPQPSASYAARRESSSMRVSTAKVDKLIDTVGELVIAQSMASQILGQFTPSRLGELSLAFGEIERHTRELQERVMTIRMLPVGTVFNRFPRVVRDLAEARGKQIVLETSGEDTELDKQVVESLSDPLTHLVRNAIDHGIEEPVRRGENGKPAAGVIRMAAFHQGGSVVVEVRDDGRGLDLARIRRKAIERGLLGEGEEPSESDLQELIFHPGFSTAESVTDLSGRGVGMDVVKRNIESLNGTVSVSSEPGRGTSFRITLPLTLAILDGLLLKVGGQVFVLPLLAISESIRPKRSQLSSAAGCGETVLVRGEPLPLVRLHRLFRIPTDVTDPADGLVVLLENQGKRLALLVDELLGQQQVVVKSLEANFRKVDGVAGATVLGDGQAALILDVAGLAQLAKIAQPTGV